jgi:hypothetical protein
MMRYVNWWQQIMLIIMVRWSINDKLNHDSGIWIRNWKLLWNSFFFVLKYLFIFDWHLVFVLVQLWAKLLNLYPNLIYGCFRYLLLLNCFSFVFFNLRFIYFICDYLTLIFICFFIYFIDFLFPSKILYACLVILMKSISSQLL